uniref:(northern house mosquito) hypothetical protein n=1 Tax=Culex pipiens TaxID=7175 RepID=A0A8D8I144_CULPI
MIPHHNPIPDGQHGPDQPAADRRQALDHEVGERVQRAPEVLDKVRVVLVEHHHKPPDGLQNPPHQQRSISDDFDEQLPNEDADLEQVIHQLEHIHDEVGDFCEGHHWDRGLLLPARELLVLHTFPKSFVMSSYHLKQVCILSYICVLIFISAGFEQIILCKEANKNQFLRFSLEIQKSGLFTST